MTFYPIKKTGIAALKEFKFDTTALPKNSFLTAGVSGLAEDSALKKGASGLVKDGMLTAGASGILDTGINALFGEKIKTDERGFQTARSQGNFAARKGLSWAAKGAELGGFWGGVGGAVAGTAVGAFEGKKANETVDRKNDMLMTQNSNNLLQQGNQMYQSNLGKMSNSLYQSGGGFYPKSRKTSVMFLNGGTILSGEYHENKGNSIIDSNNKIVAETEREELLLDADSSNMINQMMSMIDSDPSDMSYAQFGKAFAKNIFPKIKDESGKFKLNKAPLRDDL